MNIFELGENKLKAVTDWIANEARDDRWFLDINSPTEARTVQLKEESVDQYIKLANEYEKLTDLSERLSFYETYCQFEFPYTTFNLRREKTRVFTFEFKPNSQSTHEIQFYNIWFIRSSKTYLRSQMLAANGLPFTNYDLLKNHFDILKAQTPLIERFIQMEMERVKTICNKSFPKQFDLIYSHRVNSRQINLTSKALDSKFWPDLFVWPYVEYYIQLEKCLTEKTYELPSISTKAATVNDHSSASTKAKLPKAKEITFLELFRKDKGKVDKFTEVMTAHEYLTPEGRWNSDCFKPGLIVPIIDYLEAKGIIKNIDNRTQVGKIFNLQFGYIMSDRNYRKPKKKLCLDTNLEKALESLLNKQVKRIKH